MNIIDRIKKLDLPSGHYAVFGSAIMEVHGIRKANDVDLVIDDYLFDELIRRGWKRYWKFKRVLTCKALKHDDNEAFTNLYWKGYRVATSEIIKNAETLDGIAFMPLPDYLSYKKHLPRVKDKNDVQLIEKYLVENPNPSKHSQ